ncbi:MAG: HAMP domain-containing sensor histidine kinase [Patescibacteria group bacterium]
MSFKKIIKIFDITADCRRYSLGFWQCPNSLFLVMGGIIIVAMILTYWIGIQFIEPELIIAVVSVVTIILLVIGHSLVGSFSRIAEANKMKSEFVSIVSHQLRTPLSALKWSVNLLKGKRLGELNKKQEEYVDIVSDSAVKMVRLVNDLLSVNRIEQGKLAMQMEFFSIEDLILDVVKGLQILAKMKNVELVFKNHKNLPLVYADKEKIRMVVQNLIDNAIKYSKQKGGFVEISANTDVNSKLIKVSVKDNGIGIPEIIQKRIFGKFFRGDNLVKQKVEGTGLGLFIAKGIITICGGKIGFTSKPDKGSNFWFTLPINIKKINKKAMEKK